MGASAAFRSCTAMGSATLIGLAFGEAADRHAPVSGGWFLLAYSTSTTCLAIASFRRAGPGPSGRTAVTWSPVCAVLAAVAVLLVISDAYSHVGLASVGPQLLSTVPFLVGVGYLVRCRAWWAACGSAGVFATAVAMLYTNSSGGWVGFYYVYCT